MDQILLSLSAFLLILCRITAFFVVAPVFSSRNIPMQFKIGLSVFIALLTFGGLEVQPVPMDAAFILSILKETMVGLVLGFIGYMFFTAVQISGSFVDIQMGLAMANIIDPMTGLNTPITGNLKFWVATLLFLSFNGHHLLLQAIIDSYQWIPLQHEAFAQLYGGDMTRFMVQTFSDMFAIAFKMAAPMVAALFLTDVGLGILARTAPQFNIFVLGIPLKLVVGMILLAFLFPGLLYLFQDLFAAMFKAMEQAVQQLVTTKQ